MASLKIEERREIAAPAEAVWNHLIDPERIVGCLPGASLEAVTLGRHCRGKVTVRVGALSVQYEGTLDFAEIDHDSRHVRMVGKGREQGGAGSATMTMDGWVTGTTERAEVLVEADVKVSGRMVRLGRGMIEAVARELFTEFAQRLEELLRGQRDLFAPSGADGDLDAATSEGPPAGEPSLRLLPLIGRVLRSWIARVFRGKGGTSRRGPS